MKIYTAYRFTGDFIEECKSIEEAEAKIRSYEKEDEMYGFRIHGGDPYDVVDENHCSIYAEFEPSDEEVEEMYGYIPYY